jgi:hypothetical protein
VVAESAFRADPRLRTATPAVPLARGLSDSALEALALVLWHVGGLPPPRQQATIRTDAGAYRLDFLWDAPRRRVVVETDGMEKYREPGSLAAEKRRQNALVGLGFTLLRFTWADVVRRPNAVLRQVAGALGCPYTEVAADWVTNRALRRPVR